jgi:hypothetical protein
MVRAATSIRELRAFLDIDASPPEEEFRNVLGRYRAACIVKVQVSMDMRTAH